MDKAKWITNGCFAALEPVNIFCKERDRREKQYDTELLNSHVLFRRKFVLDSIPQKSVIQISADDYYYLYINGTFVCSGPAPGYPWHYYYNEADIGAFLKTGENTIAVHSYYQGLTNRVWVSGDRRHGLICSLYADDEEILFSDENWKCRNHGGYTAVGICVKNHDTSFCEQYDSGAGECTFEAPDFDDGAWENARLKQSADYKLFRQDTQTVGYYAIEAKSVTVSKGGAVIDVGREIVGGVILTAHGNMGDIVTIRYAEELDADGTLMYKTRCGCNYEERWVLSGGTDEYRTFDCKGFRYAEISAVQAGVIFDNIAVYARHYPYTATVNCPSDDKDIRRVWKLCESTIKYATQEVFVDCPTREKGQYLGDVLIAAEAQAILTGNTDMFKKAIENFADSATICPGLMAVSTSALMQEIADYSLLFPYILIRYHRLSGDTEFLRSLLPVLDGLIDYFARYERDDGLIAGVTDKWNLVDWPENMRDGYDFPLTRPVGDGCHNVINALYIGMLKCTGIIYQLLGLPAIDTEKYETAFVREFYDRTGGLFTDSALTKHTALHSNVLPLLFNIGVNGGVEKRIIGLIREKGLTHSGTYFAYFILHALKEHGEIPLVRTLIKDSGAWLNMLDEGATTTFEAWGLNQKKNTSLCHPWSCCPISVLYDL